MLKRCFITICIGIVVLTCLPKISFATTGVNHRDALGLLEEIPVEKGGLKGVSKEVRDFVSDTLIDQNGNGGYLHRHNGSHDLKTIWNENKKVLKELGVTRQQVKNILISHSIEDMIENGTSGVNGWRQTPERVEEALRIKARIASGKGPGKLPIWLKGKGSEVLVSSTSTYKEFCKKISKSKLVLKCKNVIYKSKFGKTGEKVIETIAPKLKIVVQNTPKVIGRYGGPVVVVIFEGVEIHRDIAENGFDLKRQIKQITSAALSTIVAGIAAKYAFVVLAPTEGIPIPFVGPIVHFGGTFLISGTAGYFTDQIVEETLDYIDIEYIS